MVPNHTLSLSLRTGIGFFLIFFLIGTVRPVKAAVAPPNQSADTLTFMNGDKLTGHLDKMSGGTVYFKTEGAGELKVNWGKIKELHVPEHFAVIPVGSKIEPGHPDRKVVLGSIDVAGENLTVHAPTGDEIIPIKQIGYLVDEANYKSALNYSPGILHGWAGSVTAGASIVASTQNMSTYNSGLSLIRSVPAVPWMVPDYRSILGFNSTFGTISQANTPTITTNILHGSVEQDKYFTNTFYGLVQAIFDENSTQGLNLQQVYGGGVGYTVFKQPKQELDITLTLDYTKQQFQPPGINQNLIGANISNTYFYKFPRNIVLSENSSIMPEFNNPRAYSANLSGGLVIPVLEKLSFSLQVIDSYLNDPAPGFNCNSLQINSGLTYTLP
ncbi:MAG: DUF481 domain-containing protein [Leptospirales bacterium]